MESSNWTASLPALPTETLRLIIGFIDCEALIRLLMSGNKLMKAKISSNNVVEALEYNPSPGWDGKQPIVRWAPILASLHHFTTLTICPNDPISTLEGLDISTLPTKLTSLKIFLKDSEKLFLPYCRTDFTNVLPNLTELSAQLFIVEKPFKFHLSSLLRLTIAAWSSHIPLPASVTELEIKSLIFKDSMCFPLGLRRLSLTDRTHSSLENRGGRFVASLPQSLETLIFSDGAILLLQQDVFGLPRGLKELRIGHEIQFVLPQPLLTDSAFPPNLTSLTSPMRFLLHNWNLLPKTLQLLHWTTPFEPTNTISDLKAAFASLPPKLHTLSVPATYQWTGYKFIESLDLPPSLTSLTLDWIELFPDAAMSLPTTLTSLRIRTIAAIALKELPSGLKQIHLDSAVWTVPFAENLPPSLTAFYCYEPFTNFPLPSPGRPLIELSEGEDRYLHQLKEANELSMPKQLACFMFQQAPFIGDKILFGFGAQLITLSASKERLITDEGLINLSQRSPLKSIDLSSASLITGHCFQYLPSTLTTLDLSSATLIDDSHIKHLPRQLVQLQIPKAVQLTNACIPYVPRRLKRLELSSNTHITTEAVPYMPYHLRHGLGPTFKCHTFLITDGQIKRLNVRKSIFQYEFFRFTAIVPISPPNHLAIR